MIQKSSLIVFSTTTKYSPAWQPIYISPSSNKLARSELQSNIVTMLLENHVLWNELTFAALLNI